MLFSISTYISRINFQQLLVLLVTAFTVIGSSPRLSLASDPSTIRATRSRAQRLISSDRIDQAIRYLEEAQKQFPKALSLSLDLGQAYIKASEFEAALPILHRYLNQENPQPIARHYLAYALRKTGQFEAAARTYRAYLRTQSQDADAWYGLATVEENQGRYNAAAEAYQSYAETENRPQNQKWVEEALRKSHILRDRYAKAKQTKTSTNSTKQSTSESTDAESTDLAEVSTDPVEALLKGQFNEVLSLTENQLAHPNKLSYTTLALRAGAHLGREEAQKAVGLYRQALEKAPQNAHPALLFGLGEALRLNQEQNQARRVFQQVLRYTELPEPLLKAAKQKLRSLQ